MDPMLQARSPPYTSSAIFGQRWPHGLAISTAAAMRSTPTSSRRRPTICTASGSPFAWKPAGTDAAGL